MLECHLSKERLEFFQGLVEVEPTRLHVEGRPVAILMHLEIGVDDEGGAGGQAVNTAHQTGLGGIEAVLEVLREGLRLELGLAGPHREEGLDLGGKEEAVWQLGVVERLDAEAVTRQHELVLLGIVDGKGEHAMQGREGLETVERVRVQNGLAIRTRREPSASGFER